MAVEGDMVEAEEAEEEEEEGNLADIDLDCLLIVP